MGRARFNAIILNVDGRSDFRTRRTQVLREAGFTVVEAESAGTTLRRACRADVLLLGARLADISGPELCRRVKQHPGTSSTMILEICASSACRPTRRLEAGADWFVCEPLEDEDLVATINSLVRIRWTQEQLRQRVDELERIGRGSENPLSGMDSLARLSEGLSVPLDCIATWVRILKRGDLELPLRQHGLEAIEHNISQLRSVTCELLSLARKTPT